MRFPHKRKAVAESWTGNRDSLLPGRRGGKEEGGAANKAASPAYLQALDIFHTFVRVPALTKPPGSFILLKGPGGFAILLLAGPLAPDQRRGIETMYFEQTTPERVGISSRGILDFWDRIEGERLEIHSLMILRRGKCCCAGWRKPYGPDYPHGMNSFSKTLTATAVGFAVQEGRLSLEDRLVDIFPDEMPENPSAPRRRATVRDLLTMACGHETESADTSPNWIRAFLRHPFVHEPGAHFFYNTAGTNLLAAAVRRKTGRNVTAYLRPRLFDPLGIGPVPCHMLADGTEMGGAGMRLRTEDMAKFMHFLAQKGEWEGRRLLHPAWFEAACRKQIDTPGDPSRPDGEWGWGYGFQCWMGSVPGSFRADGAYGQFGFLYPDLELEIITTAAVQRTQILVDCVKETLLPAVGGEALPCHPAADRLSQKMAELTLPALYGDRNPLRESELAGKRFVCAPGACSSLERLVGGAGLYAVEEGSITRLAFGFEEDACIWRVGENGEEKELRAAMNGGFALSECGGRVYAATARWRDFKALEMEIRCVEAIGGVRLIFRFLANGVTMEADDTLLTSDGFGLFERRIPALFTATAEPAGEAK